MKADSRSFANSIISPWYVPGYRTDMRTWYPEKWKQYKKNAPISAAIKAPAESPVAIGTAGGQMNFVCEREGNVGNAMVHWVHVCAMPIYKGYSPEELRLADYGQGKRFASEVPKETFGQYVATSAGPSRQGGLFGNPFASASGGVNTATAATSAPANFNNTNIITRPFLFGQENVIGATGATGTVGAELTFYRERDVVAFNSGAVVQYQHICCMPEFRRFSTEELRLADYDQKQRYPTGPETFSQLLRRLSGKATDDILFSKASAAIGRAGNSSATIAPPDRNDVLILSQSFNILARNIAAYQQEIAKDEAQSLEIKKQIQKEQEAIAGLETEQTMKKIGLGKRMGELAEHEMKMFAKKQKLEKRKEALQTLAEVENAASGGGEN